MNRSWKYLFFCLLFFSSDLSAQKKGKDYIDSLVFAIDHGAEDSNKVNALNDLASEFRYSNTDTALYFVTRALDLATKLQYEIGIADCKLKTSALYASRGRFREGLENGYEALRTYNRLIASSSGSRRDAILKRTGRAYLILGHNYISQGNYPEGLKVTLLSLKIKEEQGDKKGICDSEYNLGNIYSLLRNYPEALKHHRASLKISEELGLTESLPASYNAIGWIYIQMGDYSSAMQNSMLALKLAEKLNDNPTLAEVFNSLAVIYQGKSEYDTALKYFFASLEKYALVGIDQQIPDIYNCIGLIYMAQKKFRDASVYFDKALNSAKAINSFEFIKAAYENRSALDSATKNYGRALADYKLSVIYKDSLFNQENTRKMVQQEMQYDFDKKETVAKAEQAEKDARAKEEIIRQRNIRTHPLQVLQGCFCFLSSSSGNGTK